MLIGGSFGRKYQVDQQEQRSLCSCPCRPTAIANQPTRGLSFLFMFAEKVFISHWISWRLRKTLNSLRRHNELQKWCVFVAISATFLSISCFVPWGICNNELFYFQMYYSRLVADIILYITFTFHMIRYHIRYHFYFSYGLRNLQ